MTISTAKKMGLSFKIDHEEATYFIKTTVVDFQPVLTRPGVPIILYDSFEPCQV